LQPEQEDELKPELPLMSEMEPKKEPELDKGLKHEPELEV